MTINPPPADNVSAFLPVTPDSSIELVAIPDSNSIDLFKITTHQDTRYVVSVTRLSAGDASKLAHMLLTTIGELPSAVQHV